MSDRRTYGSRLTAQGQFSPVADPSILKAGGGEPDLASWLLVNPITVLEPELGTHRSPEGSKPTSPGALMACEDRITFGAGDPDLGSSALVTSTAVTPAVVPRPQVPVLANRDRHDSTWGSRQGRRPSEAQAPRGPQSAKLAARFIPVRGVRVAGGN